MNAIRSISFHHIRRLMNMRFTTSLGSKAAASSILVTVTLEDGSSGCGEVPTSFSLPLETPGAIKTTLRAAKNILVGAPYDDCSGRLAELRRQFGEFYMTLAGLEVAIFRAALACQGVGEHAYWGGRLRRLETDITVSFLPGNARLAAWLAGMARRGFRVYKVKVSGNVQIDIAFVSEIRDLLAENMDSFVIRLDGNQGYTTATYIQMLRRLDLAGIAVDLFEQPLRKDDLAGMRKIRGQSRVPVILDESVFTSQQCRRVIDERLADGVNIKIAKSGIVESAAIMRMARSAGLKLMIGCMTETMVGLSAGIRLAAGTGAFDYIDLDSVHLMRHHNRHGDIRIEGREYVMEDAC